MDYLIPQSRDTICRRFSDSVAGIHLPKTSSIQIIHYDEQHPKAGRSQKYRLTLLDGVSHEVIAEEVSDSKSQEFVKPFFENNLKEAIEKSTPLFIVSKDGSGSTSLKTS